MSLIYHSFHALAITVAALAMLFVSATEAQSRSGKHPAPWVGKRLDGKDCKSVQIGAGPWDYLHREKYPGYLAVTEENHFNEDVEALRAGITTEPMGDIHYTLSAWPNHHRALKSAVDFRLKHPKWPEHSKGLPAECYLVRAINYSPKDGTPYLLLGILAHRQKQYKEALNAYERADELIPNDMIIKYNMALTLVQLKKYKEAKRIAEIVYASDFPLPGLKNKLKAAGQWEKEPKTEVVVDESVQVLAGSSATKSAPTIEKGEYTDKQLSAMIKEIQQQAAKENTTPEKASP